MKVWNSSGEFILDCDAYNSASFRNTVANEISKEAKKLLKGKPAGAVVIEDNDGVKKSISIQVSLV